MTKNNIGYAAAALFVVAGAVVSQQPEKKIQLPPITLKDFNIMAKAFDECDCPQKSTAVMWQGFVKAAQTQAPEWFGIKPDSTGKAKGGKP